MSSRVDIAKAIATLAHAGQVDKVGRPYIEHPARVAAMVERLAANEIKPAKDKAIAAAWLHDVLEDTSATPEGLRAAGVDPFVVARVSALTHVPHESAEGYCDRINESGWLTKMVKLADIDDNMRPERLALLDDATIVRLVKKYAKARRLLGAAVIEDNPEETE